MEQICILANITILIADIVLIAIIIRGWKKMSIGTNMKEKRISCGMTQKELAEKVNVDQSMICQIERGTKAPSLPLSLEIAAALNCSIQDFTNGAI